MKVYAVSEIEQVVSAGDFQSDLIRALADGFEAFERGEFAAAPVQTLGAPPLAPFGGAGCYVDEGGGTEEYAAQTCVKSGYFRDSPYYVIKVASGGYPWKDNSGCMQVYLQKTGKLEAMLLDDGLLTEIRTAAVGALACQLLAPKRVTCVGVVGVGVQARYQVRMLRRTVLAGDDGDGACRKLLVYGRNGDRVRTYADEMREDGWDVSVADRPDLLLERCQLVVTTTPAREPVLGTSTGGAAVKPKNLLITCVGSDAPGKVELATRLVQQADLCVADWPEQSRVRGEFQNERYDAAASGGGGVVSLGRVVRDAELRRRNDSGGDDDDRFVIFDSSGVALQDCVIAEMVYEALKKKEGG